MDRSLSLDEARRVGGDALPFEGDHGCVADGFGERGLVVEGADDERSDRLCRRLGGGIEETEAKAEWEAGEAQHAPELAASEDGHERRCGAVGGVAHVRRSSATRRR